MVFSGKRGGFSRRQYSTKEGLVPIRREGGRVILIIQSEPYGRIMQVNFYCDRTKSSPPFLLQILFFFCHGLSSLWMIALKFKAG